MILEKLDKQLVQSLNFWNKNKKTFMGLKKRFFLLGAFLFLFTLTPKGQDFVYTPINPAFGGNYMNHQWMLQSAEMQNKFEEEEAARDPFSRDPLEDFEAGLSRQILNQISRQVMSDHFGEGPIDEGRYLFGDYEIEVTPGMDGLVIYILDTTTGGETTITIPHF